MGWWGKKRKKLPMEIKLIFIILSFFAPPPPPPPTTPHRPQLPIGFCRWEIVEAFVGSVRSQRSCQRGMFGLLSTSSCPQFFYKDTIQHRVPTTKISNVGSFLYPTLVTRCSVDFLCTWVHSSLHPGLFHGSVPKLSRARRRAPQSALGATLLPLASLTEVAE